MNAWVGVDLDGTLAAYDGWQGPNHIGPPIMPIVNYVKDLIDSGVEVRIVTARASTARILEDERLYFDETLPLIRNWCYEHLGKRLEVTAEKDYGMLFLIDDRAYRVDNGVLVKGDLPTVSDVKNAVDWHYSSENPGSPTYVKAD